MPVTRCRNLLAAARPLLLPQMSCVQPKFAILPPAELAFAEQVWTPGRSHVRIQAAISALPALALPAGAPASQGPQSLTSLLTVAQLRAVPATAAEVGPSALASARRSSLRGYPSGVCR